MSASSGLSFRGFIVELIAFLENLVERNYLEDESRKLTSKPPKHVEKYSFLEEIKVHPAAKWWHILTEMLKMPQPAFPSRYIADIDDLFSIILSWYAFTSLCGGDLKNLGSEEFQRRFKERVKESREFDHVMYELIVAASYKTRQYDVKLQKEVNVKWPDLLISSAGKPNRPVFIECKKLEKPKNVWNRLAIEALKLMTRLRANLKVIVEVNKFPSDHKASVTVMKTIQKLIEEKYQGVYEAEDISIEIEQLPNLLTGPRLEVTTLGPLHYGAIAGWIRQTPFNVEWKNPRFIGFRAKEKPSLAKPLLGELSKAYKQIRNVADRASGVVSIDISNYVLLHDHDEAAIEEAIERIKSTLREHSYRRIAAVVLTWSKIVHIGGAPAALVVDKRIIKHKNTTTPLPDGFELFPGWTVVTRWKWFPENINPGLIVNQGVDLARVGQYEEAIRLYNLALTLNPSLVEAWNNKGNALNMLQRFSEALECLDRALSLNPQYPSAWVNKGISLANLDKGEESIGCFNKAIEFNPTFAKAWYNKGLVLLRLNKKHDALFCANEALRIEPDYEKAKELRRLCEV